MSFQEDVFKAVKRIHLPASSNAIYLSMANDQTLAKLPAKVGREKVRKALYCLQHDRKVLTSEHDDNGILIYSLAGPIDDKQVKKIVPEELQPAHPQVAPAVQQEDLRSIMKDLCLSLAAAFHHAYTRL